MGIREIQTFGKGAKGQGVPKFKEGKRGKARLLEKKKNEGKARWRSFQSKKNLS